MVTVRLLTFFVFIYILIVNFDYDLSFGSTVSLCVATKYRRKWLGIHRRNGSCAPQPLIVLFLLGIIPIKAARCLVIIVILEVERVYQCDYEGALSICFKLNDPAQSEPSLFTGFNKLVNKRNTHGKYV